MNEKKYPEFGILLVDDEPAWLLSLTVALERCAGITNVVTCQESRKALDMVGKQGIGLVLLDLVMPQLGGEEFLELVREQHPEVATIVISGMNQLETAVRCVKLGAFDYFVKTDEEDRLINGVMRAVRMIELERENRKMSRSLLSPGGPRHPEAFSAIITADRAMQGIFAYLEAIAQSPQPILVTGESGVGKEQVAQVAHKLSGRQGAIVAVNVAGLDDQLFADTLFGHVRGAFSGAEQARRGMIEEAADGTLFLDEIGDLSIPSQVKLLRLLQEGEYFPLGSDRPKRIASRVIVATHQDLAAKLEAGTFRRDLYYRLCTHLVRIPPLRERKGDIPLLLGHFLEEAARALGKKKPTPPKELAQLLANYAFPGNVRELKAMVYDAVSVHRERILSMETFLKVVGRMEEQKEKSSRPAADRNLFTLVEQLPTFGEAAEMLVEEAMARAHGNQSMAARLLGITQSALCKRLKRTKQ